MKKIVYFIILGGFSLPFNAQVLSNFPVNPIINNSSVMLDGSSNFSTEAGAGPNTGKGIVIPSVNLVNFEFDLTYADGFTFPTYFDGMIVYNNASGPTLTSGNRSSTATAVEPGFYYFSNPTGAASGAVQTGVWKPIGGSAASPKVNILTTETVTNTLISGSQLYAIKGQFNADGNTPNVTIPAPAGITSMYGITIYKAGTSEVYARSLYSYNPATGAAVTGFPGISSTFPSGTYQYVLEYIK